MARSQRHRSLASPARTQGDLQQVEEFLHKPLERGALGGAWPEEAYRVTIEEDLSQCRYQLRMQLTFAPHNFVVMLSCLLPSSDGF